MESFSAEEQLLFGLGYCGFMVILFAVLKKYPPKKINHWYGYRTHRSMSNTTIWKAANQFAAQWALRLSLYSLIVPIVCYFLFPSNNFLISILVNTLAVVAIIPLTENYLNKHFDKNGNPKAT